MYLVRTKIDIDREVCTAINYNKTSDILSLETIEDVTTSFIEAVVHELLQVGRVRLQNLGTFSVSVKEKWMFPVTFTKSKRRKKEKVTKIYVIFKKSPNLRDRLRIQKSQLKED